MKPRLGLSSRPWTPLSSTLHPLFRLRHRSPTPSPSRLVSHREYQTPRRSLHDTSSLKEPPAQAVSSESLTSTSVPAQDVPNVCSSPNPLSLLPLPSLLRSYVITSLSTNPLLLRPAMAVLSYLAHSTSPILSPDKNPLLRAILKRTFYAQFCAGENTNEVRQTMSRLKEMGYKGVMLGYAREVVMDEGAAKEMGTGRGSALGGGEREMTEGASAGVEELEAWKKGTLDTVQCATKGDMVALKFTGAGSEALRLLSINHPPSPSISAAISSICDLAKSRSVNLLFDAEQDAVQRGIDSWTLSFMRRYNSSGHALIYNTYQAYLRSTPTILATHLLLAKREGFVMGVKLVRGAYLGSDPRHLFWAEKEETDRAYNGIAESLIRRSWNNILQAPGKETPFPEVNLVLASHNLPSVETAMRIREDQARRGESRINMVYAQLMGMADHVSCKLILAGRETETGARGYEGGLMQKVGGNGGLREIPQAYKYLVWGTVGECLKYLLRRAEENRDAVTRTEESRVALRREVGRRMFG